MEHRTIAATAEYDEKTESNVSKTLEFGQIKMYEKEREREGRGRSIGGGEEEKERKRKRKREG